MTPADQLRTAAQTLRTIATAAQHDLETADYWKPYDPATAWRDGFVNGFGGVSSDLAALLPPAACLALADWLDWSADGCERRAKAARLARHLSPEPEGAAQALAVARQINGGPR